MDDTLYPLSSGLNLACRKNIEGTTGLYTHESDDNDMIDNSNKQFSFIFVEFMLQYLHIEESEVPRMCLQLYRECGTTMAGLKVKNTKLSTI